MTLPTIKLGEHNVGRLLIGGNPFSGFSHQSAERDREMMDYYTVERIKATLRECEAVGINTAILRTDAHIWRMLYEYRNQGGRIQWIAQMAEPSPTREGNIDRAVRFGAFAYFIHGGIADDLWQQGDFDEIARIVDYVHDQGLLAGIAGHVPQVHLDVAARGIPLDFHVVSLYNCGSVHKGAGEKFDEADPSGAIAAIQQIEKPCIAYKILAAGRQATPQRFRYVYENIKPSDAAVVGMFTKDDPNMVEKNARLVTEILAAIPTRQ